MNAAHRSIRERVTTDPPGYAHPDWLDRFPWLVQGTTSRGEGGEPWDLGLFTEEGPEDAVRARWDRLLHALDMEGGAHARQLHGAWVRVHEEVRPGLRLVEPCDGHATGAPGLLLAVTVADCVPVSIVDPERRAVALLHAGWRGAAKGILTAGLAALAERFGSAPDALHVHLGPSICGRCYEVGPEVFAALAIDPPPGPAPLDLRGWLAERALEGGVRADRLTVSELCTLCGDAGLFSHRGGDRARQVGYLGVRS